MKVFYCVLCDGVIGVGEISRHHLRPQSQTRRKKYSGVEGKHKFIYTHKDCHNQLHKMFTNQELMEIYNEPEKLKAEYFRRNYNHSLCPVCTLKRIRRTSND